jgi:secreted trypsin-like serine protease
MSCVGRVIATVVAAGALTAPLMASHAGAAVVSGELAGAELPAVVAISNGIDIRCSGVLVGSAVVLSAAHCFAGLDSDELLFLTVELVTGADQREERGVHRVELHPAWLGGDRTIDVAAVVLAEPAPAAVRPMAIAEQRARPGQLVRVSGFGTDGDDPWGVKRIGMMTVAETFGTELELTPSPSSACGGDSGGGIISRDVPELLALISRGDVSCTDYVRGPDVTMLRSWIEHLVATTEPGSGELGAACFYDALCISNTCARDVTGEGYCTYRCDELEDGCPAGTACIRDKFDRPICADPTGGEHLRPPTPQGCSSAHHDRGPSWLWICLLAATASLRRTR